MQFLESGFQVVDNFISDAWRQTILNEMQHTTDLSRSGGIRHINKKLHSVSAYLDSAEFQQQSSAFLPAKASLVRALLFNKSTPINLR